MVGMAGCGSPTSSPARNEAKTPPSATAPAVETAGSDGLNDADRAAAAKQKTCPVTDEALGSMGTPVKVAVKGRDVYLCCAGCKAKLLKDVDGYLAKLDKQSKK